MKIFTNDFKFYDFASIAVNNNVFHHSSGVGIFDDTWNLQQNLIHT